METDQHKEAFIKEQAEAIELLSFIAGFNKNRLTEEERDRLDEWIIKDDFILRLFEICTDKSYEKALRKVSKSLRWVD